MRDYVVYRLVGSALSKILVGEDWIAANSLDIQEIGLCGVRDDLLAAHNEIKHALRNWPTEQLQFVLVRLRQVEFTGRLYRACNEVKGLLAAFGRSEPRLDYLADLCTQALKAKEGDLVLADLNRDSVSKMPRPVQGMVPAAGG